MTAEQNKSPLYKPAHGFYHDFQGVDYPINPACVFRSMDTPVGKSWE